jgi:hypothetical protein
MEIQKKRGLNWAETSGLSKQDLIKILVKKDAEDAAAAGGGGGGSSSGAAAAPASSGAAAAPASSSSVVAERPENPSKFRKYSSMQEVKSAYDNANVKDIVTLPLDMLVAERLEPWLHNAKTKKSIMFVGESHIGTSIRNRNETIAKQIHLISETIKQNSGKRIAVLSETDHISINGLMLFEYVSDASRINMFYVKRYLDSISPTLFKINPVTTDLRTATGGDRLYMNEIYRLLSTHDIVIFIVGLGHIQKLQDITEQDKRGFNYVCINSGSKDDTLIIIKEWLIKGSKTNMFDYFNYFYPFYDGSSLVPSIVPLLNVPVKPRDATYQQLFAIFNAEQSAAENEQKRKAGEGGGGGGGGGGGAGDLD